MVKKVLKTISLENAVEECYDLLKLIKPSWNREQVALKVFDNGITNKMFGFYLKDKSEETVLIRINGSGTETFLDRSAEVESFHLLHEHNCAPELYCSFNNGLCYQFIPGDTLTTTTVCDPVISKLVIKEMVKMHCIRAPEKSTPTKPSTFTKMRRFLELTMKDEKESSVFCTFSELQDELNELEERLVELKSPIVFCHNDLLIHNIVHNKTKGKINFIDYEYAAFNYQAFDIANHFCEYAGIDNPDYSLWPNQEYRMNWLKLYLIEDASIKKTEIDENELNEAVLVLFEQVEHFSMASHLFWGLWAMLQAKHSEIDFDYNEYANIRLRQFFIRKSAVSKN